MGKIFNSIKSNYTIVPNGFINDKTLTPQAKYVFIYMLSKPDDWEFFVDSMSKEIGFGKDTLRKYIAELELSGWVIKVGQVKDDGRFAGVEYILSEAKSYQDSTETKISDTENFRHGEFPTRKKSDTEKIVPTKYIYNNKEVLKEQRSIIDKSDNSISWRDDLSTYITIVEDAHTAILADGAFRDKIEGWYNNIDFVKSIEKTADWWMSPEGWEYCKRKRKANIDMVATIKRNIDRNRIYKPYGIKDKASAVDEQLKLFNEARGNIT